MDARTLIDGDVLDAPVEAAAPETKSFSARSQINVRLVEAADRIPLQNLLMQHHAVTEFRNQPFSPWKFNQNFDHVVSRSPRNDGVLVIDANGDGKISSSKEFVFTEWAPTGSRAKRIRDRFNKNARARTDFEALKQVFDTNDNGMLDAGDARFGEFRRKHYLKKYCGFVVN